MSINLNHSNILFTEGNTQFYVPKNSINDSPPPRNPAFFNTLAKFKRDILITLLNTYASTSDTKLTFADVLSSVGATGIRLANESNYIKKIYFNDANPIAIEFLNKSLKKNKLNSISEVSTNEANKFLSIFTNKDNRLDFIDIDPFGSPIQYIDSAIRALKINGILSLTATDGAVLCGVYPKVCLRKYGSLSLKTEYFNEIAIRILLFSLATISSRYELGIKPIFCHTNKHYIQVYVKIVDSVSSSDGQLGFLRHCTQCNHRVVSETLFLSCDLCSSNCNYAGPLWIGNLFDQSILTEALSHSINDNLTKLFEIALTEISMPPLYYVTDVISKNLGISSFSIDRIISKLHDYNLTGSRTILHPTGFRTNGNINDINRILSESSTNDI